VRNGGPEEPHDLVPIFTDVSAWIREESGVDLIIDDSVFRRRQNRRGNATTQARIAYRGPNANNAMPKVKIDITSDEVVADRPAIRPIGHPYSDSLPMDSVLCYSIEELFGEKLRALAERCRPRDLYDVVHMHRHPDLIGYALSVRSILSAKCQHAGIDLPTLESIQSSPHREELQAEWANMLGHQLPQPLVPFDTFWSELGSVFTWLDGTQVTSPLPRAEIGEVSDWIAPTAMASWRLGVPMELLRYAGANRLRVEIDYRAEQGRHGPRTVEPYSLRRTLDGNLLLYVVNDHGMLRGYRVDRIAGIRPTTEPFTPRFRVEF
jgi:predicted nucleotidyltransferase component of viral defense system